MYLINYLSLYKNKEVQHTPTRYLAFPRSCSL